jgi:hypothetical protein
MLGAIHVIRDTLVWADKKVSREFFIHLRTMLLLLLVVKALLKCKNRLLKGNFLQFYYTFRSIYYNVTCHILIGGRQVILGCTMATSGLLSCKNINNVFIF